MRPFLASIRHTKTSGKDVFSLWTRKISFTQEGSKNSFLLNHVHNQTTAGIALTSPFDWPVPADSAANLGEQLKWLLESYPLCQDPVNH